MIFEAEVLVRDTVRMNVLKEVMAGETALAVQLDDAAIENYAVQVHRDGSRVRVYGNFNMSESVDGQTLTIRPISVDKSLKIVPALSGELSEKSIVLVRSATKKEENRYPFDGTLMGLELIPSGNHYLLRLEYADTQQPPVTEEATAPPPTVPTETIQPTEPPKPTETVPPAPPAPAPPPVDTDTAQAQTEEYQKRLQTAQRVIPYYQDTQTLETLLKEIADKLEEAEKQIALLIQAKQQKTMEIEGSIKG